jgi:hypothetical protein
MSGREDPNVACPATLIHDRLTVHPEKLAQLLVEDNTVDTVGTFRDKSAALRTISTFDLCRRRLKSPSDGIGKLFFEFLRQPGL